MIDEADWSRLARYFAGEAPPAELEATRQWLAADADRALEADALRKMWSAAAMPSEGADTNAAWERLAARMEATEGPSQVALYDASRDAQPVKPFSWRPPSSRARGWALAAASLVLVAAGWAWLESHEAVSSRLEERVAQQVAPDREFHTVRGQRAVIVLADGSRVELAAESELRVRPFGAGARELFLDRCS
jgi:ferric-dicitrate binding protein FerR (iron transport regulator)